MLPRKDIIYVVLQGLLFLLFIWDTKCFITIPTPLPFVFLVVCILGIVISIIAVLQLNKSLSPFPTPLKNGELITNGVYRFVRHPIYTGIILATFGYGFYTGNCWRLTAALLLLILFFMKSNYEEKLLEQKYEDYSSFKASRGRFFPKLF